MSYLPRSEEEARSGGKIVRGRLSLPSVSPYFRPQRPLLTSSSSPPRVPPRNPSWISGVISGAGKLISSVFASDGTTSSSSSGSSSDGEDSISTSNEDIDASSEELHEINQEGNKPELKMGHVVASSAIIPLSESKLAIKELLMQETFSRDECRKLIEIIQSRVVDYSSLEVGGDGKRSEIPNNTTRSPMSFLGACHPSTQHGKLQEASPHSPHSAIVVSPRISILQACAPDLHAAAILEAKKWIEEKKTATSSNANLDRGPCTLSTDMLQYGIEVEVGSPVDMAKSYMKSLPPWQSPSLCNLGFKTPPPGGMHLYKAENHYSTTNHSFPSSKVLKRNYNSIGAVDKLEEIRKVRLKSIGELHSEDHSTNEAVRLLNQNSNLVNHKMESGDIASNIIISKPGKAFDAVQSINENLMPTTSEPSRHEMGSATKFSDLEVNNFDINNDVEEPSQTKERIGTVSVPPESLALASTPMEHDGDPISKGKKIQSEETKSAASCDANDIINLDGVHSPTIVSSSAVEEASQADKSSQLSDVEERHPIPDSKQKDGNAPIQKEAIEPRDKITDNGASKNLQPSAMGPLTSNEKAAAADKTKNGTRMKSIERLLRSRTKPAHQPSSSSRHGRKPVARPKRGKAKAE